jgi:hypothetical protein
MRRLEPSVGTGASILHEFYNGLERIFERIAIGLGEGLPRGARWHRQPGDRW